MASPPDLTHLQWTKKSGDTTYLVSTQRDLIDVDFVNAALGREDMPWARTLSQEEAEKMLDNSLTFGLYQQTAASSLKQIGMARFITDHITFAYLTDVIVLPEHRRGGLARWLITCCGEMLDTIPAIRRSMLLTSSPHVAEFYKETLGVYDINEEPFSALTSNKHGRKR